MIEVEVRARLEDCAKAKETLEMLGARPEKTERQVDRVFGHEKFLDSEHKVIEGAFSARIREAGEKKCLDFKEILRHSGGIEVSAKLADVSMGIKLLQKLGFEEAFTVEKKRETFLFDGFEICIDCVEKLGNFIEVEKIIDSEQGKEKARNECLELLERIMPGSKIEHRKYGDLMQELINEGKKP